MDALSHSAADVPSRRRSRRRKIVYVVILLFLLLGLVGCIAWDAYARGIIGISAGPSDSTLGPPLWTYQTDSADLDQLSWAPDNQHLVFLGGLDAQAHVFNMLTRQVNLHTMSLSPSALTNSSGRSGEEEALSPNGKYISITGDTGPVQMQVWNVVTGQKVLDYAAAQPSSMSQGPATRWSPDSHYLAVVDDNGKILLWNAVTQQRPSLLVGHATNVESLAWSRDGYDLAASTDRGYIETWNVSSKSRPFISPTSQNILSLALSPDGTRLAVATEQKTIEIWNIASETRLLTYADDTHQDYQGPQWAADNRHIVSVDTNAAGQHLRIWDATTGQTIADSPIAQDGALLFSPDGNSVAIKSADRYNVQVWDSRTGRNIASHPTSANESISILQWSPNGAYLVTERADHALQIWNATTGKDIYTYPGSNQSVWNVSWSSDGAYLAALSTHMTYTFFDFGRQNAHFSGSHIQIWRAPR